MTNATPAYETEACTRCRGSGTYSWCETHGSVCFKCAGTKKAYTKRGIAARAFADELRAIKITDVKPGTRIYWGRGGRCTVGSISEPQASGTRSLRDDVWVDHMQVVITGQGEFKTTMSVNAVVRLGWLTSMVEAVEAYQATLTKAGTVSKRKAKKCQS